MMSRSLFLLSLLLCIASLCYGFYLPGVAPKDYPADGSEKSIVKIKANKLASTSRVLPFEYFSLPYCQPQKLETKTEFGEIFTGERTETLPYQIKMKENIGCRVLKTDLTGAPVICPDYNRVENINKFIARIEEEYIAQLTIDGLPVANKQHPKDCGEPASSNDLVDEKYCQLGAPVGCKYDDGSVALINHLSFTVHYHQNAENKDVYRVVGAEVVPTSVKHNIVNGEVITCKPESDIDPSLDKLYLAKDTPTPITWSYSVQWKPSAIRWASRWDAYLDNCDADEAQIHWFSIINSLMIVLFLTGMVAMIMMRTLHKDFTRYNAPENAEEAAEETGWKLVHGDVFRTPTNPAMFATMVGSGAQVFGMAVITICFALLGFLSPANRGSLMSATLLLFVFMGILAGYYSARTYKMFHGQAWKTTTLMTAFFFPGVLFAAFFVLNFIVWVFGGESSGAIPIGYLFALVGMWFGISVPLVFLGSYFGYKQPTIEHPVRTNQIPRQIPEQPWYIRPPVSVLMGGVLPFGAVFIELFFILSSIWLQRYYYVFGFLFIVFGILILTCAEITIVMIYFQLCNEDYHWWWRSFMTAGSSALYLFLYSAFYFFTKLSITNFLAGLLFFGYMAMVSFFFFVLTGAIGYFSCFWFTRTIYAAIKID